MQDFRALENNKGFTFLELTIVIVVISFLIMVALEKFYILRVRVEQTKVEHQLGIARSALAMAVARHILDEKWRQTTELVGTNPFALLVDLPENYLGEMDGPDPAVIDAGNWYFDLKKGELIYRVLFGDYLESQLPGPARLKFHIAPVFEKLKNSGGGSRVVGLSLRPVESYQWLAVD